MNYYQYHIGDYRTATAHLSLEEDATYKRLLDYQYDKETPIPNDPAVMARRLRSTEPLVRIILQEFFVLSDEGWINKRVMETIGCHQEFIEKQKHNGRKGGRSKTQAEADANPSLTLPITNTQLPITNKKKEIDFSQLPEALDTPQFRAAWSNFVSYRAEKKKPIFQGSFVAKWKQMQGWGASNAVSAIHSSIANGWQGIFSPAGQDKPKSEEASKFKHAF